MKAFLYGINMVSNREVLTLSTALIRNNIATTVELIDPLTVPGDGVIRGISAFVDKIYYDSDGPALVADHTVTMEYALSTSGALIYGIDTSPNAREIVYNRLYDLTGGDYTIIPSLYLGDSTYLDFNWTDIFHSSIVMPRSKLLGEAIIGNGTWMDENCTIDFGSSLGSFCFVGPNCYIGPNVLIGTRCILAPGTRIIAPTTEYMEIGADCWLKGEITQPVVAGTRMF